MKTCNALAALAILVACSAVHAQRVTEIPPGEGTLEQAVSTDSPGQRFVLRGGETYTLNAGLVITEENTGLHIKGPATSLPGETVIEVGNFTIDLETNTELTLENLTIKGGGQSGSAAIVIPPGATVNASRVLFSDAAAGTSVRVAGTFNVASSVFTRGRGILQTEGVSNIVQCTFISTPQSIQHTGGIINLVANLFRENADRPTLASANTTATKVNWFGNLVDRDPVPPSTSAESVQAPIPTQAELVDCSSVTVTDCWPGKLDPNSDPLFSNVNPTDARIAPILEKVDRTGDFEMDKRGVQLQVGADELQPIGRLDGWLSGQIITNAYDANGRGIAGKSRPVYMVIEVGRAIDLDDAELVLVPQLSTFNAATPEASIRRFPVQRVGDSFGYVNFTAPDGPCQDGWTFDGVAEMVLIANGTTYRGNDFGLDQREYMFVIDTVAPRLTDAAAQRHLTDALLSSDPVLLSSSASNSFPVQWGPERTGGKNPSNATLIGGGTDDTPPEVFFNWDIWDLNNGVIPQFQLAMQYYDPDPDPCANNFGTVIPSGFSGPTAVSVIDMDQAYNGTDPGVPFLSGSVQADLASATSFSQDMLATSDTLTGVYDIADVTWDFQGFAYDFNGWRAELVPGIRDLAGNTFIHPKPLVFWWLAPGLDYTPDVARLTLQGPEDPENPVFSWTLNRPLAPNRRTSVPCVPLVSYRLWGADDSSDTYSNFSPLSSWSPWVDARVIDRNTPFTTGGTTVTLDRLLRANRNRTMLLTILAADEAGNLQSTLVDNLSTYSTEVLSDEISSLFDPTGGLNSIAGERLVAFSVWGNKEDYSDEIDTKLRARLFWNRYNPFGPDNENIEGHPREPNPAISGERDFGSSTRIPLPPLDTCQGQGTPAYRRVEAQFQLTAESNTTNEPLRIIEWQFLQEGRLIASGSMTVYRDYGYRGIIQIPEDLIRGGIEASTALDEYGIEFTIAVDSTPISFLQPSPCPEVANVLQDRLGDEGPGGVSRRRNITYTFRAATEYVDQTVTPPIPYPDETPATFQFTVTTGDEFETGEQPIKIFAPL
jgi:hypothetical protein